MNVEPDGRINGGNVPSRAIRVPPLVVSPGGGGLAQSVARQIADAIHLGLMAPGEQLPSEGVLAGHLGVSTMTLREALVALRQEGLIETRRGRNGGSFVRPFGSLSVPRVRDQLRALSATELRDIGDERLAVQGTAAQLAARRASAANVEHLRDLSTELVQADSLGDKARTHNRFWIEVSLASQSERLTYASMRLQSSVGEMLWLPGVMPIDQKALSEELVSLAQAIAIEADAAARRLAESLLDRTTRWLIDAHLNLTRRRR
ncbi:MAG: GntR family transcriptional regulator [Acidimicrobiia bacterium]|nr:GntR family transcriptional regulator [Acidimicrobiia bacterium]